MSIETNISVLPAFVEQILTYVNHIAVEMMRTFHKNLCHSRIGFGYEVVYDEKRSLLAADQNVHVVNALHKFDTIDASEQILITTKNTKLSSLEEVGWNSSDESARIQIVFCHTELDRPPCK